MSAGKSRECDGTNTVHNGSVKGKAKIKCKECGLQSVLQDQEERFYANFKPCRTRHYFRKPLRKLTCGAPRHSKGKTKSCFFRGVNVIFMTVH